MDDGQVITWGDNEYGQCGVDPVDGGISFTIINQLNNIAETSCGSYHTLAISHNQQLFVFGRNYNGECGLGEEIKDSSVREIRSMLPVNGRISFEVKLSLMVFNISNQ